MHRTPSDDRGSNDSHQPFQTIPKTLALHCGNFTSPKPQNHPQNPAPPLFPSLSSPPLPFQIRPRRHPPLPSLSSIQIAPPSLPSGIMAPRGMRARRVLDERIVLPTSSPPRASQSYYQPTPADATPVTPRLPRWSPRRRSRSGSSSATATGARPRSAAASPSSTPPPRPLSARTRSIHPAFSLVSVRPCRWVLIDRFAQARSRRAPRRTWTRRWLPRGRPSRGTVAVTGPARPALSEPSTSAITAKVLLSCCFRAQLQQLAM